MGATSARDMLSWLERRAMRGIAVAMVTLEIGCILPPEYEPYVDRSNRPPEIDLETVDPKGTIFEAELDVSNPARCFIDVGATIRDRDNSVVFVRWAADNRTNLVQPLDEDTLTIADYENGFTLERSFPAVLFTQPLIEGEHRSIELFVSDSNTWDATEGEIRDLEKDDFG